MNGVFLSAAKNLPCDGQMLHFVQHDSPSNKPRQSTKLWQENVPSRPESGQRISQARQKGILSDFMLTVLGGKGTAG